MSLSLEQGSAPPRRLKLFSAFAAVGMAVALLSACDSEPVAAPPPAEPEPVVTTAITAPDGRSWRKLTADGLHDPDNDLIAYLQEPAEALSTLSKGGPAGNQVDWMESLRQGLIAPRTNIWPETKIRVLDLDIVFSETAGQPMVVFPHRQHTEWLDCSNCHPVIFKAKEGANDFGMLDILQGEYCGRCHGAVSFPLTECKRCHSRDRRNAAAN